jgi:cysteine desulfurase
MDHACVVRPLQTWKNDLTSHSIPVTDQGDVDHLQWEKDLELLSQQEDDLRCLHWTYAHNETGVVWPLEEAIKWKKKLKAFLIVDAVQAIGRLPMPMSWPEEVDAYTFSGHKFGSLKGIGMTLLRKDFPFHPLVEGGGQQQGLRSGTENPVGIYSIYLALKELQENFDFSPLLQSRIWLEKKLKESFGHGMSVVCEKAKHRNGNTVSVIFHRHPSDIVQAALDLKGVYVSMGSACSSGTHQPSRILLSLNYPQEYLGNMIRFSLPYFCKVEDVEQAFFSINQALGPFFNVK